MNTELEKQKSGALAVREPSLELDAFIQRALGDPNFDTNKLTYSNVS